MASEPFAGNEPPGGSGPKLSPLTYGKVYGAIPRVTGVNTPNINQKIAKPWGLPLVNSSVDFKKVYVEGRAALRYYLQSEAQCSYKLRFYQNKIYKYSKLSVSN